MACVPTVACPHCHRDYVGPLDLPEIVIEKVTNIVGESEPAWSAVYHDCTPNTIALLMHNISPREHDCAYALIQTTVSASKTIPIVLQDGRPGLMTVTDKRPASLDYSIHLAYNPISHHEVQKRLTDANPLFRAGKEPVRVKDVLAARKVDVIKESSTPAITRWPSADPTTKFAIGWLKLPYAHGPGTFDVEHQKYDGKTHEWVTETKLWRVTFRLYDRNQLSDDLAY